MTTDSLLSLVDITHGQYLNDTVRKSFNRINTTNERNVVKRLGLDFQILLECCMVHCSVVVNALDSQPRRYGFDPRLRPLARGQLSLPSLRGR